MTEATTGGPALYAAMLAVMGEIGYVQKTGHVKSGRIDYKFAGEAALLAALRPHMVAHGLLMFPVGCQIHEHHEMFETKWGPKPSRTVRVVSTYRLAHSSGESVDIQVAGEGQDQGDKAAAKAMTIALKYALRQAFLIETGNDPDTTRPEHDYEPAERKPAGRQQRQSKPQDAPLQSVWDDLKGALRDAFGASNTKQGFERAEELAQSTLGKGIAAVFDGENGTDARALLRALEG